MEKFTFNYRDFYASFDNIRDNLRIIKLYLIEREETGRKNGWELQADSIKEDLEMLENIHSLLDEVENNY